MTNAFSQDGQPCPCGSGNALADCCGPLLAGQPAPSAARLMRSRYTAYVLGNEHYLSQTWHPSTRPPEINATAGPKWIGLQIIAAEGEAPDTVGRVEFIARYLDRGRPGTLHETSRFVREGEQWFYVTGEIHPTAETSKTGRNEPCPCGSGKKYKRCCGM